MPPLKFWFTGNPLLVALPTLIGTVLGLVGISQMVPHPTMVFATVATFACCLWAWGVAVQQESKRQIAEEHTRQAQQTVQALLERLASPPVAVSSHLESLQPLSSAQIRQRVSVLVPKMRTMEAAFRGARDHVMFGQGSLRRENWEAYTNQLLAQSSEQKTRWQSELMPEAVALYAEMRRRMYGAPPYPEDHAPALDHGMLAGVDPLNEAALILEQLARQIP